MSDGLTAPPAGPGRPRRSAGVVAPVQALGVVALFAGAGAAAGRLWFELWDVPTGVVSGG